MSTTQDLTPKMLTEFRKEAQRDIKAIIGNSIRELCTHIIDDTPVGDPDKWNITDAKREAIKASGYIGGNLKNNWNSATNAPDGSTVQQPDASASRAKSELTTATKTMKLGEDFYFSNSIDYAYGIEMGVDGPYAHKRLQAPQGMMRKNLMRWDRIISRNASLKQS